MGKGRPRSVEKGGLGQNSSLGLVNSICIPSAPVYYPTEDEFKDPLEFIYKIRPEAERFGICKIVPPESWKPPFALDLDKFMFPTKTQAIHRLQVRPASCDSKTFELEYNRFLEGHGGKKAKKRVVFEGEDLDLCKLFNAVKRFGGYDRVVKEKKWGEVSKFVRSVRKISDCAKHVLCQLYREHLYDYESYYSELNRDGEKSCGGGVRDGRKCEEVDVLSSKRRGKNQGEGRVELVKVEEGELDQICEQCRSGLHGEVMLLCDRCNKGWHIYCLSPPLKQIPAGNWYCFDCLNSEKDSFGFVPGRQVSLEAFRRIADRAKRRWFGSGSTSRIQLEKKFWEIVEGSAGAVEVKYGSDLDTSVYGSGFPRVSDQKSQALEAAIWDEYCASPWNLNNLPKLQGSMLRAVHHSIAGVMVPWLYIGMLFSSFCWHFEDHCFYSMNYHHWGEPKCWYSVPGSEASAFEKVMRDSLPDLFDAQPDLLFQLVTMLNPSVLQNSNVPVYSVLQEPGNFVITFPRSYHGGFNFGLNCAEAVNFAPADWLPHGGSGAELYQLYRKAPVLSQEELICVVAKTDFDSKVTPYLMKELLRIYNKEKTWRARLWRNGIVRSTSMSPRKQPQYVGVEEDPTCIICQQFLYLSAVACRCRPSTFVCLEHWKHLCECKANKHRLLYRHSLAELNNLMLNAAGKGDYEEATRDKNLRKQQPCSLDIGTVSKKVGGVHVTLVQLAEDWLLRSCKLLQMPYSIVAFANALKEAEQFLWGDSEMDSVREATRNLIEAQNWVEGVRDCVDKVESWSCHSNHDMDKVHMEHVRKLLSIDPVPCNEPEFLKLKDFGEEAEVLIQEIESALSMCPQVSVNKIVDLEILHTKACALGIFVEESRKLSDKLSFVKIWIDSVRKCIAEKSSAAIEVDILYKLKSEVSELLIQLPEIEMLGNLTRQLESCQSRCNKILNGSINLKHLELFLEEMDGFTVNVPELKILKQYQDDAVSWISRFNNAVQNSLQCNDQENVVDELTCIMKDGALLKIQVDELSHAEVELKKAQCRLNGLKALQCKVPLDTFKEILVEASRLQIGNEKLFINISGVLAVALSWEERANHILSSEAQISDFEDLIRTSEGISVFLPSLKSVKEAVSTARSWLNESKPFLCSGISVTPASKGLLKFEALKELVAQSELLKICLVEKSMLQKILDNCIQWELHAYSVLDYTECLLKVNDIKDGSTTGLTTTIERQIDSLESVVKTGPCLHFDFVVTQRLHDACAVLRWCLKSLSFRDITPAIEEVLMLLEVASHLPTTYASYELWSLLVGGVNWLKNALEILLPCNRRKFRLSYVEEVLQKSQIINVSFSVIVSQLKNAIEKHNLWLEQVQHFVSVKSGDRSSFLLFQLKELGSTDAFNCSELEMVFSEVERVEQWRSNCENIAGLAGNVKPLRDALSEINRTLDRSLHIYDNYKGCKQEQLCVRCFCELKDQKLLTCSFCNDCYHFRCIEPTGDGDPNNCIKCICPYCDFINSGNISRSGGGFLKNRKQLPSLNKLTQMLSSAELLCVWIEERDILCQIVEKAELCRTRLTEVADIVLAHVDKDLNMVAEKLSTVLKAVEAAGVYDHDSNCKFDLPLARNSWRVRAQKLLEPSLKPTVQQIQRHLKEGSAISIPLGDYFREKLMEVKYCCTQWVDKAKKVSVDSGELELDKVYDLIMEGNDLHVDVQKELKLLQDRSMLYCICRKPYDQRAMIACDKCDEWYHFDCIKLTSPPKVYACPACKLDTEYLSSSPSSSQERSTNKCEEPQTPSPGRPDSRRRTKQPESLCRKRNKPDSTENSNMSRLTGFGNLLWRNRKPFRRVARKREELDILSPFFMEQEVVFPRPGASFPFGDWDRFGSENQWWCPNPK